MNGVSAEEEFGCPAGRRYSPSLSSRPNSLVKRDCQARSEPPQAVVPTPPNLKKGSPMKLLYSQLAIAFLCPVEARNPARGSQTLTAATALAPRLGALLLVFVLYGPRASAQTFRGAINGTVLDPSGAFVPSASVKATEKATGIVHRSVTTTEGQFAFQDIPPGLYTVSATASGFTTTTLNNVEVVVGQIHTLAVQLKIGQATTAVEVTESPVALDTTTQTQSMTLPSDVVQNVPLNGRDFTQLISIEPGFGGYNVGGFGSLNGTRPNQINWQIDGVDNNDLWHNIPAVNQGGVSGIAGVVLPIDSVVEFSAQTQSGPEAGRNAGGTVNLVTRSGSNTLHGSAYYYNRNEALAAHSPFFTPTAEVPKAPPLRNENYGASVGGPILKNKLFYFANYEEQSFRIGLSGLATEPSDAWVALASDLLNNPGGKYGSYAPVAASAASATAIGPNGFWPRSGTGSIATLPATLNNFFSPIAETGYSHNGVAKLDYQISDTHHLSLRWFGGQGSQAAPLGSSPALGTASSNLKNYFEVAQLFRGAQFRIEFKDDQSAPVWLGLLWTGLSRLQQQLRYPSHGALSQPGRHQQREAHLRSSQPSHQRV
ncbi:MAG: hypothetical protein DMG24_12080 [Acidobacteria bacterium]|nr:MAG: hypothetical protein DMG24_12080 [Acidobacteriota bacterium]